MTPYDDAPSTFLIDGIPYQAWAEPDLSWLSAYGTVFRVMDRQSPAHLLFGVEGATAGCSSNTPGRAR